MMTKENTDPKCGVNMTTLTESHSSANEVLCMDIWLKVFACFKLRQVVTLRYVCRSWNEMINTHILKPRKELIVCLVHYSTNRFFRKEHISDCYYVKNYRQLLPLFDHHQCLQSLKVFNFLVSTWFLQVSFENLNSVFFNDCTFLIDINNLFVHIGNITKLEIINSDISDEHIRIIGQNILKIVHLNVSFNNQLSGAHISSLSCTLRSLNLSYCLRLNDYKLCYSLQELLTKGVQLELLNLKPLSSLNNLPYTSFFVITSFKQLKTVKLSSIPDLTLIENSLPEINELENLTLFGRIESTEPENIQYKCDYFLRWMFNSNLKKVRRLSFADFPEGLTTDDGFLHCLHFCQEITRLKLNNIPSLKSKSLIYIAELKQLQYLKFVNINLDDKTIITILKKCHCLQTLIIDFLDTGLVKPYNLSEAIIHECIYLCDKFPNRSLKVKITKSLLPTHKLFTIPKNLILEIVRSRFLIRKRAIYIDDPVQM